MMIEDVKPRYLSVSWHGASDGWDASLDITQYTDESDAVFLAHGEAPGQCHWRVRLTSLRSHELVIVRDHLPSKVMLAGGNVVGGAAPTWKEAEDGAWRLVSGVCPGMTLRCVERREVFGPRRQDRLDRFEIIERGGSFRWRAEHYGAEDEDVCVNGVAKTRSDALVFAQQALVRLRELRLGPR